jgi:hypothetical protein
VDEHHSFGDTSRMQEVSAVKSSHRDLSAGNRLLQRFDDILLVKRPVPDEKDHGDPNSQKDDAAGDEQDPSRF